MHQEVDKLINQFDLSIIIPVYNAELYLVRCLDSILNSSVDGLNYEVICINDGSKDQSLYLLKKYKDKFDRLVIIDTENAGAASARNKGLENAKGEYIWFVDADDFIETNALEIIYHESILKGQSIGFKYNRFTVEKGKHAVNFKSDPKTEYLGFEYAKSGKDYFLWLLILKRNLIVQNNLKFIEGIKNIEDFEFMITYFSFNDKLVFIDLALYNYNDDNIVSTSRNREIHHLKKLADDSNIVHHSLKNKMKLYPEIGYFLNMSVIGFFNSLRLYYSYDEFDKQYHAYKLSGFIPLKIYNTYNSKFKIFGYLLNYCKPLFKLIYKINKK